MKQLNLKLLQISLCVCLLPFGCSQQNKDKDIKAMIASRAKTEWNFIGVNYTVTGDIVTLSGKCPTEKAKTSIENAVKNTAGVKQVVNHIRIEAVILNADLPLKQSVDSVLTQYASAQADVKDSIVVVKGEVQENELQKLLKALSSLSAKKIENQLTVLP